MVMERDGEQIMGHYCKHILCQWCTTFFSQGQLINYLNLSGARQVRQCTL